MLRFAVFEADAPARSVPLAHACAIDKQGFAIPAVIECSEGIITVKPSTNEPAAFCIGRSVGDAGILTLQTTPLPAREKPYLLDLELARHRIMLTIMKLEEWGLASILDADDPVIQELDAARELMTAALCAEGSKPGHATPGQAELAAKALERAVLGSEKLALRASELVLSARLDNPAQGHAGDMAKRLAGDTKKPNLGCILHNDRFAPPLQQVVKGSFDFIASPVRWNDIEPEEGRSAFRATDRWIEWAVRQAKMPVHAGPILDFHPRACPDWLTIWEHDYESLREFAYEHCAKVVKRYRRAVRRWIAISAPTVGEGIKLTVDQWVDLARLSTLAVRKGAPSTPVSVEIAAPFALQPGGNESALAPRFLAEMLLHAGVQFDTLALRIQLGTPTVGASCRDLMQLSSLIDDYADFEHPIDVTVLGVPSAAPTNPPPHLDPGYWRSPTSEDTQARFAVEAMTVLAGKPAVRSIAWQALFDLDTLPEQPFGGLISAQGKAKPALAAIRSSVAAMRTGRVPTIANVAGTEPAREADSVGATRAGDADDQPQA